MQVEGFKLKVITSLKLNSEVLLYNLVEVGEKFVRWKGGM